MEIKPLSSYQKFVMAMLAITQFTVVLDFMVMSPLGDILMKSLVITPKQFGIAVSSYAFSAGISGLLAAGFADKFDRKKLLIFFYLGFIVGTFLCGMAPTYETLVAARIFTGIFGGVMGSISMAIITDIFELNQRGRVMGIVQMGFAASQVLGIPMGLYFANLWGWHAPFMMIVVLAVVVILVVIIKLKPVNAHLSVKNERNVWAHFRHVLFLKNYRIAFLSTALLSIGGYLMMPFGSAFAVNNLGVLQSELPLIFMLTGVSSLIFMPLVGKLSDRYDKFKIFAIGSVWAVVFTLIYTNLSVTPLYAIITLNILLFMGISSRMIPSSTLTSAIPNLQDRGAFMSINSSLQQIAGGIATMLAGLIIVQKDKNSPLENYPILGIIGSIFILMTVWFIYRVYRIVKNKEAQPK
ncbi:MFS transporter [Lacihabitans soyangensis]|uniref:MFS transporter n=1 Tax=Lacihabitans soyangensis TaxID=869394 RepID=A0AAE3H0A4_9BACT|nr:MFS transporter [Lacihabitans soyangensis]MCP9761930.1 MFS transporter [Lacihabitans soyangensis]